MDSSVLFVSSSIKNNKHVRFSPTVRVILIPTIDEYFSAGIADLMWWTKSQYKCFKHDANQEVTTYIATHSAAHPRNYKSAISALYQPQEYQSEISSVNLILENQICADILENCDCACVVDTTISDKTQQQLQLTIFNPNELICVFSPSELNVVSPTSIVALPSYQKTIIV